MHHNYWNRWMLVIFEHLSLDRKYEFYNDCNDNDWRRLFLFSLVGKHEQHVLRMIPIINFECFWSDLNERISGSWNCFASWRNGSVLNSLSYEDLQIVYAKYIHQLANDIFLFVYIFEKMMYKYASGLSIPSWLDMYSFKSVLFLDEFISNEFWK